MPLPFSSEDFFEVFRDYNQTVWPSQAILLALALLAILLIVKRGEWSGRIIAAILSLFWVWIAIAYHVLFFAAINPLSYVFAAFSLAGSAIFGWYAIRGGLRFAPMLTGRSMAGGLLLVFALVVYPLWSVLAGHAYPAMPTFGLPCPTTIFTIGILGFLVAPYPRVVLAVPVLWCAVGSQAAFLLDVPQDLGLMVAGLTGLWFVLAARQQRTTD